MAIFEFIRFLFPLFPFLMLSVIFVASYWVPSTTLPAMEAGSSTNPPRSAVDKHCRFITSLTMPSK
ncbi:hypothetical protein N7455_001196 [Penicillium solitum]|uniref:uncharacterized protein n=1 Tax=Penicillium solitum TaxID=60172 RepID=UPI00181E46F2|nr:hypothetical protein HAV15_008040 [Penicillium sp. str. \